jgi:CubicO group peptidase (beta-lactamase class C family)
MRLYSLVLLSALILLPVASAAQTASHAASSERARSATDRLVRAYMREQHVPGVSVAVVSRGRIAYTRGYGWANLEDSVPVTPHTRFPSASTAKLLTATAILQLVGQGKLALDDSIQTRCPAYPGKRWPVTIGRLLVHQGGIRSSNGADVFNRKHYGSVEAAVGAFADDTLVAEPGTRQVYSNAGYVLLACAIEGASGMTYGGYLESSVLGPAGMTGTTLASIYRIIPHRAAAYMVRTEANTRAWDGLWTPAHLAETTVDVPFRADPLDESFATGASDLLTTPSDLARFVVALDQGRLIGSGLLADMLSDHPTVDGQPTQRGFGWVVRGVGRARVARLSGSVWIGSSAVLWSPANGLAVVVCTNLGFQQPDAVLDSLAGVWGARVQ